MGWHVALLRLKVKRLRRPDTQLDPGNTISPSNGRPIAASPVHIADNRSPERNQWRSHRFAE
jgi:hypothetical protein